MLVIRIFAVICVCILSLILKTVVFLNLQRQWNRSSRLPIHSNVAPGTITPGVSLVAACKGRPGKLRKTAVDWLHVQGVDDILLVDWSSEELEPVVHALPGGSRIKVIPVEAEKKWILSRAFNLAVNATAQIATIAYRTFLSAHLTENENGKRNDDLGIGNRFFYARN